MELGNRSAFVDLTSLLTSASRVRPEANVSTPHSKSYKQRHTAHWENISMTDTAHESSKHTTSPEPPCKVKTVFRCSPSVINRSQRISLVPTISTGHSNFSSEIWLYENTVNTSISNIPTLMPQLRQAPAHHARTPLRNNRQPESSFGRPPTDGSGSAEAAGVVPTALPLFAVRRFLHTVFCENRIKAEQKLNVIYNIHRSHMCDNG